MNHSLGWLLGFAVLAALDVRAYAEDAAATSRQSAVERHGRLSVKENRIVDEHGRVVVLRGMSLFWSQWGGQYYNADCVKWLRDDWGCTVVRAAIGVGGGGYLKNREVERQRADAVIRAAIDLGIYVIVDWHAHDAQPAAAQEFFAYVAKTYGKHPNVIYETWNEPIRQDWAGVIKPYHEAVLKTIRAHDPDNLVVCGTPMWSQRVDQAAADPVKGKNVAYTLHFYASTHKQDLRDKAKAALDKGVALFVTEWGTSEANGNGRLDAEERKKWLDFVEGHGLSTCNWSVIDKRESSAALAPGAAATGGWTAEQLSPSGRVVREMLRERNGVGAK